MTARFGVFTVDSEKRQVLRDDRELHLTPKAFDLLVLLIEEAPRVVPKAELHARLWPGTFVSDAALVGLVKQVRRVLRGQQSDQYLIRTSHGVGYAFGALLGGSTSRGALATHWVVTPSRRIALSTGENLIGRDPACTVWLEAAGVSRRHARIIVGPHGAQLEDLASKNGTCVRETPLNAPRLLSDGDTIQVGQMAIIYRAADTGVSTETIPRPARSRPNT